MFHGRAFFEIDCGRSGALATIRLFAVVNWFVSRVWCLQSRTAGLRAGGEEPDWASLASVGRLQHVLELNLEVAAVVETDEEEQQALGL